MEGTSNCPQLPLEIWTEIIGSANQEIHSHPLDYSDLPHIRNSFRLVSRTLKAATEAVARKFLRDKVLIYIDFNVRSQPGLPLPPLEFTFDSFSDDDERVVMTLKSYDLHDSLWLDHIKPAWRDLPSPSTELELANDLALVQPWHVICMGRKHYYSVSNDTELPEFRCDYDKATISFDWKRMFRLFFGEWEYMGFLLREFDKIFPPFRDVPGADWAEWEWDRDEARHEIMVHTRALRLTKRLRRGDERDDLVRHQAFWKRPEDLDKAHHIALKNMRTRASPTYRVNGPCAHYERVEQPASRPIGTDEEDDRVDDGVDGDDESAEEWEEPVSADDDSEWEDDWEY